MADPTEIPAMVSELSPLLLPECEEVATGFDDVGVVVEADKIGLIGEELGDEAAWWKRRS